MKICVPVTGNSFEDFLNNLDNIQHVADFIELRLDCIPDLDEEKMKMLKAFITKECIITFRKKEEGGANQVSTARRFFFLETAIKLGFDFIDVEMDSADKFFETKPDRKKTKIILSFHDFEKTPPNLEEILKKMEHWKPDVCKIITTPQSQKDIERLYQFILKNKSQNIVCFGLGDIAQQTRIITPFLGSLWTCASSENTEKGEKQMDIQTMKTIYSLF